MKLKNLALICVVFSALNATAAHAFDLSALGALTISNYSFSPQVTPSFGAGTSLGLGVLVGSDLIAGVGFEVGAFYMARSISASGTATSVNVNYGFIEIPAMIRVTTIPFVILEAGPYVGIGTSASVSTGGVSLSGSSPRTDFGLKGGAGLMFPILPLLSLRAEGMYSLGFTDISTAGTSTQNSRNIDILAGVTLSL
jgi:hypothetical protein